MDDAERLTEAHLEALEGERGMLIERGELRFLHPLAASLIENEVPLLVAEVRRLRGLTSEAAPRTFD